MNICVVTHNFVKGDGQGRVNYEIAREALKRNHRLTLYSTRVAPEIASHPNVEWIKIPVKGWPTQLVKNQIFALISSMRLLPRRRAYDVVVMNGFIAWAKCDVNAIHFVHSAWLKSAAHPFRLKRNLTGIYQFLFTGLNALLERVAFRWADCLIPVSEKVKAEVASLGFEAKPHKVIFNGADLHEFYPKPSGDTLTRSDLGLPEGVTLALFAGDIKSPRKNLDTVLKAMVSCPDLHLAIAGALEESPYPKLAEQLGVDGRVHFLGFRRDVANLMRNADFFVFPSRYEACTLVVIEALASGLPVITTYQSGVSELVDCGIPGFSAGFVLANPEDKAELTRMLTELTVDMELRSKMAENARAVAEQYSWGSVAGKYMDLFEEVAAKKNRIVKEVSGLEQSNPI